MSSYPIRNRKFLKNRKKIQKLKKKKNIMASFKPRQDGKGREREKKKIIPMGSHPTRNRKL